GDMPDRPTSNSADRRSINATDQDILLHVISSGRYTVVHGDAFSFSAGDILLAYFHDRQYESHKKGE
ncbi:MAG TPA: hypothetical protein VKF37_16570, partial [Chloroflexota bacterium]|nr:hypothetical protein [Chloroflexota bacterium]